MTYSKLIAGLVGPVLAAMGIAMLVNHARFPAMIGQLAQDQGLIFLTGILSLLGGLAIVRVYNIWIGGGPVIITVLGWLAIFGGLARNRDLDIRDLYSEEDGFKRSESFLVRDLCRLLALIRTRSRASLGHLRPRSELTHLGGVRPKAVIRAFRC